MVVKLKFIYIEWCPIDGFLFKKDSDDLNGNDCFLDACVLYLPQSLDNSLVPKIKKIIRGAGGTCVGEMDGFVTHVIVATAKYFLHSYDIQRVE